MTASDFKECIDCGASFKRSRTDSTVRCMDCRAKRRRAASSSTKMYEAKMYEAKSAAYAARRAHDAEAEAKHTADYLHYRRMMEAS